ncbi:MAG: carboxypeptidase regulatory-like domain-containing protein [Prevotellaceae bacterium]|nr:carboxypeptidase regulatory-like domain-containing protein [Prevotellaceae bacterium]
MLIWLLITSFCYSQSSEWMSYDNGVYYDKTSFDGTRTVSTYDIAIKYTSEDILTHGFTEIHAVKIYNSPSPPPKSVCVKIWQGTNAATEVVSKAYTPVDGWNEIALDATYSVDVSQDLWIGVRYESNNAAHPHACMDASLDHPGKGNLKRPIVDGTPGAWVAEVNQLGDWNIQFLADGFQTQESEILLKAPVGTSENALFYHNGLIYTANWKEEVGRLHAYQQMGTNLSLVDEKYITGLPALTGAPNFYGFASDGDKLYAINQTKYIYVIDFNTFTLQETIEAPFDEIRGGPVTIAYDAGLDGFWCSYLYQKDAVFINKDGTLSDLTLKGGAKNIMGLAYDDVSAGGPYLWASTGNHSADNYAKAGRWNLQTGVFTEDIKNIPDILENPTGENYMGSIYSYQDIHTGKHVLAGVWASQSLVFAYDLHNTFDLQSPAQVSRFSLVPEANGELEATLLWKNPTKKINGSSLDDLTEIKIYRDDQPVHTIPNPTAGAEQTWTDNASISESKVYSYKIVGVNSVGEGLPAIRSSFVGQDIPGSVSNLILVWEDNAGKLTWDAPVKGGNDGWINQNALTYTVVRHPDNLTVAENIAETFYTDNSIPVLNLYSYTVTVKNIQGESKAVTSNTAPLGVSIPVPWRDNFSNEDMLALWTIINANEDYDTWNNNIYNREGSMQCVSWGNDDWLISPAIALESGIKYNLRWFHNFVGTEDTQSHYELSMGKLPTVEGQTISLGSYDAPASVNDYEQKDIEITVAESGNYHFAWHSYDSPSENGSKGISIDDVSVDFLDAVNLSATAIAGPTEINAETDNLFTVTVKNEGFTSVDMFEVSLLVYTDDNVMVKKETVTCSEVLNSGEEKNFPFSFNTSAVADLTFKGAVTTASDNDASNDTTLACLVKVYPKDNVKVLIGDMESWVYQQLTPFNCFYEKNAAQSIFYEDEIGTSGVINALEYYYSARPGESVLNKPVQIYMAITQEEDLYEGWVTKDTVLVYDGLLNLPDNRQSVTIYLPKPFVYTGGNIMIYTVSSDTKSYYSFTQFQCTNRDRFRTRVIADHYAPFDFTQTGRLLELTPNISFIINKKGASISGTVTDGNQSPMAGATVEIEEKSWRTVTDADGKYEFVFVPKNMDCTVIASKPGYSADTQTVTMYETEIVSDFTLTACEVNPVKNLNETLFTPEWSSEKHSSLQWEQPDDIEGNSVTGYRVYVNHELKAKLPNDTFSYLYAVSQGNYVYEVSAVWDSGCESITLSKDVEVVPDTVIREYPFFEDFESGEKPAIWKEQYLQNNLDWEIISERSDTEKTFMPHSGQFFISLYDEIRYMSTTRLITPMFDFSSLPDPYLSFWHIQALWGTFDRDILVLKYKNTPEGKWKELVEYDEDIESWKKEVIQLPEPSATYWIAFEGISKYGYGVMLDDIKVSDINGTTAIPQVEQEGTATVEIFPNPASTTLTVRGENIEQAEIYNMLGQIVETVRFQGEHQRNISVTGYESGVYLLKVSNRSGEFVTRRVLVAH